MTRIETLANDIAMLSNTSLDLLAQELVKNYTVRGGALADMIRAHDEDQFRKFCAELGVAAE
jgi:hypothetical protein